MSIVLTLSNHYKYQLMKKLIDLSADSIKIILMNDSFAFDKDAHAVLTDVTGGSPENQLATEHGYTMNNKELANKVLAEDDINDKGKMTCDDVSWTAAAGAIGPTGSAIIYDDTSADKTVIGCIDYGTDYTINDGSSFLIKDIEIATS